MWGDPAVGKQQSDRQLCQGCHAVEPGAVFGISTELSNAVIRFNRMNGKYQVIVESYGYSGETAEGGADPPGYRTGFLRSAGSGFVAGERSEQGHGKGIVGRSVALSGGQQNGGQRGFPGYRAGGIYHRRQSGGHTGTVLHHGCGRTDIPGGKNGELEHGGRIYSGGAVSGTDKAVE